MTLKKLGLQKPDLTTVTKNTDAFQLFIESLIADQGLKCSEVDKNTNFVTSSDCEKNR